jgi:hypothetical protein
MIDSMVSLGSFISPLTGGRVQAFWDNATNELVTAGSQGNERNPSVGNLEETLAWLESQGIVIE